MSFDVFRSWARLISSIRDIGFNAFETTLMDVVRNVFQMIGVIGAGYFATKVKNSASLFLSPGVPVR